VDGVILATDDGDDHVRRARPFVDAGLPVFVDKPLATNHSDLMQFSEWIEGGARIASSSGMRYAPEIEELRGNWRWIAALTPKTWERYGIHLLEPISRILGPEFETIRLVPHENGCVAHITHISSTVITISAINDAAGGAFTFHAHGVSEYRSIAFRDTYSAFRGQLEAVVSWMGGGGEPVPFAETKKLMNTLIAGIESRKAGGIPVHIPSMV